ncbi:recombinase family protein [Streptomyces acidicola]|uniref:recombinase family protein n=1 Tax=Streptomyces acidicola TaxID=2596892 RepID=UPI00380BAABF
MTHSQGGDTMTIDTTGLTAREYLRVSVDRSGTERSPEEQHAEHAETAAELGIVLGKPYMDIGSASRYAKRARDDFQRLMDDLRNDRFGADLLWLWESSRGSRKTGEWVTLLDLCEDKGVRFYVQTHERILDPRNGNDRRTLLLDAVDSEHESYKISKRVLRGVKTNLNHEGGARGHGICPFGYSRTYQRVHDAAGRRVMRPTEQEPDPKEAQAVIELFFRIRAGHSMASIERDFAARGIVGRRGRPMSAQTMRGMVRRVAYIGKREHKGQELDAAWPCIADFEGAEYDGKPVTVAEFTRVFHEVQTILDDPTRKTNHSGGAKHALSGALKCDPCGESMTVTYRKAAGTPQPPAYQCHGRGCTRINKEETDEVVLAVILGHLAQPYVYQAITPEDGGAELATVQVELMQKRADLKETQEIEPETLAEDRRLARREERLEEEIGRLERREIELTPGPSPLAALFDYGPDVSERWEAAPVAVQRQIAQLLLSPELLGETRVKRVSDSASGAVTDRLRWVAAS